MSKQTVLLGTTENGSELRLNLKMANRHGLVAGATGTGKTVTLRTLVKGFAERGVTVFAPDVKGDLAEIAKLTQTRMWNLQDDSTAEHIRVSVKDLGATLFARLLQLTEAQEGVVLIMFAAAEARGLPLDTMADVRAMLEDMYYQPESFSRYGFIDNRSVMTVQRKLLMLNGAEAFFGPTNFSLGDLFIGTGVVNILQAERLINESPLLYAMFLLWLLNRLFAELPEIGDVEQPGIVLFFDEAHLLFADAPKALVQMVERTVRLIRSKGVGVYFVSQSPADIPDAILAQLSNRVQHALRGYSVAEQRALKAASVSFRPNREFRTLDAIQSLGVGQALVSVLDETGAPTIVEKVRMHFIPVPNTHAMIIRKAA